jgi:hypothetical protein
MIRSNATKIIKIITVQKCIVAQELYAIHTENNCIMPENAPNIRNLENATNVCP